MSDLTADLTKHRILAVDDEADNLEVLKATLEVIHGAVVCAVTSCSDALACLDSFRPTLIVTDISMPQVDGYGLLKLLKERPDTVALPVVAVSAHAMKGDRERILSAGFDGYIGKPFEIMSIGTELEACLRAFIARQTPDADTVPERVEAMSHLPLT